MTDSSAMSTRSATDEPTVAPYGSWTSPITPDLLTAGTVGLREPGADGDDLLWIETRATEGGRAVLVRQRNGQRQDLTPEPFNVRSRVHEYGGGAWAAQTGLIVFSNYGDNRLYRLGPDDSATPVPITPEGDYRYADLQIDTAHDRLLCIREDHSLADAEPVNTIVSLSLAGPNDDGGQVIVSGTDFVASPALSADGTRLAWLSWNHPNMPWDGTELWTADLDAGGTLTDIRLVAGGTDESIFQPQWMPNGDLIFVSDRGGWWNLFRATDDGGPEPLAAMTAEFGLPQWVFGMSTWDVTPDGRIVCAWTADGVWSLGVLDPNAHQIRPFALPFTSISDVHALPDESGVLFTAGSPTEPGQLVKLDLTSGDWETVRRSSEQTIDHGYLTIPEAISWPTLDGSEAHGFFYEPRNKNFRAPDGELPPVIVESHGGPTSATSATFDLEIQYWTSRGFAVLDVNYGGSTGYGRAYRERLNGAWGVVDVDDCIAGVTSLAEAGRIDPNRAIIRGGSAGGYTTLAALAFRDVFRAGVSYYGIGDLEALAMDTHKFESRYLDGLIGAYPEAQDTYIERSPIHHVDGLSSAMILFQGLDDKVVAPNQAEAMAEAVRAKGLPVALLMFEGEGHGFRKAETVHRTLGAELSFYGQVFSFDPAGDIEPVTVENLPVGVRR